MGFLLAGVLLPLDLLALLAFLMAGVYICIKITNYVRRKRDAS